MEKPVCKIDECARPVHSLEMCQAHYRKFKKYGTATPTPDMKKKPGPPPNPEAPRSRYGPARANEGQGRIYKHLQIGETCTKGHLLTEANTFTSSRSGRLRCGVCRANAFRRHVGRPEVDSLQVPNSEKTHCKNGHEFTPDNTVEMPDGSRGCVTCRKIRSHDGHYKKYGIKYEDKVRMIEEQEGKCRLCKKALPDDPRKVHLDHFHDDGTIRGVLCGSCNYGLGCFKDSPELLMAAAQYLMDSNAFRFDPDITTTSVKT